MARIMNRRKSEESFQDIKTTTKVRELRLDMEFTKRFSRTVTVNSSNTRSLRSWIMYLECSHENVVHLRVVDSGY